MLDARTEEHLPARLRYGAALLLHPFQRLQWRCLFALTRAFDDSSSRRGERVVGCSCLPGCQYLYMHSVNGTMLVLVPEHQHGLNFHRFYFKPSRAAGLKTRG